MNLFLVAGEISGDLYASYLVKALQTTCSSLHITAIGGPRLKQCADQFIFESAHHHGVSFHAHFLMLRYKHRLLSAIHRALSQHSFDKVIIVDFQHVNHDIASLFQSKHIPIYTFITPNFWMWRSKKSAKKVCSYSDKIFTIFEPEYDFYSKMHPNTFYFGHPMCDIVSDYLIRHPLSTTTTTTSSSFLIHLLPGSRPQEFCLYFKAMLETMVICSQTISNLQIVVSVSSPHFYSILESYLSAFPQLSCTLSTSPSLEIMRHADCVICGSGTATLEAILLKKPLIVLAALPSFTYFIAKYILRLSLPYISLPNFLTQELIVPEFVQSNIQPSSIASHVLTFLSSPDLAVKQYHKVLLCLSRNTPVYTQLAAAIC